MTISTTDETAAINQELQERIALFTSRVQPLGVRVERVPDSAAAAAFLAALRAELGAPGLVVAGELRATAPALAAALDSAGVPWIVPADAEGARDAPLGVSLSHLAVAETGSVMLAEETLADRAVGLVSKTHLVIVRTERIVPSLVEAAAVLRAIALRPGGGYVSLVTGPSRTADIELSLTVGVQGPERLLVLFVDELT